MQDRRLNRSRRGQSPWRILTGMLLTLLFCAHPLLGTASLRPLRAASDAAESERTSNESESSGSSITFACTSRHAGARARDRRHHVDVAIGAQVDLQPRLSAGRLCRGSDSGAPGLPAGSPLPQRC